MHLRVLFVAIIAAMMLPSHAGAASVASTETCLAPVPPSWTCMRVTVPEDYGKPDGRTAFVHIVVARAEHPLPNPDAVFFLQGGPGMSGTLVAGRGFMNTLGPLQATHDLVAVDQRGVSGADALICPPDGPADKAASYAASVFTAAHARKCAALFKDKYDLKSFTTPNFARDLEQVRLALGYAGVKFVASGYSSRIVQDYLHLYPGRTQSAVLTDMMAMDAPGQNQFPQAASASLEAVLEACDRDQPCRTFYPDFRKETTALLAQLSLGGIDVTVARDGLSEPVHLEPGNILFWLYGHFHFMDDVAAIPSEIHTLMAGSATDKSVLALNILGTQAALYNYYAVGEYFSVACSEDIAFIGALPKPKDAIAAIYQDDVAAKREACREWPRATIAPEMRKPVFTDVPMLLVVSELSPASPPEAVARAAASFGHATLLILANHGEGFDDDWNICPKPEAIAFLESNGKAAIDANCGTHFLFRPFKLR